MAIVASVSQVFAADESLTDLVLTTAVTIFGAVVIGAPLVQLLQAIRERSSRDRSAGKRGSCFSRLRQRIR